MCTGQHMDRGVQWQDCEELQRGDNRGDDAQPVGHPHLPLLRPGILPLFHPLRHESMHIIVRPNV